ncbi:putative glutamine amidotransferase [Azospirillum lipoferum]|uniref:Gamma-glutamyl-gamma-aminobutyrate hydrolase family protein n=1 Tax=Azospirillum lipoferum TaxID=193 RepID=A0A5A9GWS9_AZOLI|nr:MULTISPECIES: gamma-glutamyl-gamma-aminobutyrate hydrolase family protein [Azospirillum]KAA0598014.1 gamma-glutamyl-gamma-aminobutyrate hydrolase family protein [Azospirillum lipoferum]MCP1613877.1 putative glutamine amidotransferase [Azospirillum lipoferum]MDW5534670.1 gamma-glutamyl-gamma-aminobutyrate hydrolase family protein [Azospirillum sp. NL1]
MAAIVGRSRPLVGITASVHGSRIAAMANRLALWRAGASSVRITADSPFPIDRLDALVVGGGDDIDASLYGESARPQIRIDPERDRLEMRALDCAAKIALPVLGICRGSQMINVHRGGSLHVDIHEVYEEAPQMRTVLPRKRIRIEPDSRLYRILGIGECRVNALHHQSVDRVGDGLRVVARERAGVVQGIEAPDESFMIGVQWHPEYLVADSRQQALFRRLVATAAGIAPLDDFAEAPPRRPVRAPG